MAQELRATEDLSSCWMCILLGEVQTGASVCLDIVSLFGPSGCESLEENSPIFLPFPCHHLPPQFPAGSRAPSNVHWVVTSINRLPSVNLIFPPPTSLQFLESDCKRFSYGSEFIWSQTTFFFPALFCFACEKNLYPIKIWNRQCRTIANTVSAWMLGSMPLNL